MSDVFISYSRVDQPFVRRLHAALAHAGRETWVDWEGIPPTAEWLEEIYAAVDAADTFVFILGEAAIASVVCRQEIDHAVLRRKRLVPVLATDVIAEMVPEALRRLNWVDMRSGAFDAGLGVLLTALDTDFEWVKGHTRLLTRATEWQAKGSEKSLLLRGRDLRYAQAWLAQAARHTSPESTPLQVEFIVASGHGETRRQRIVLAATVMALGVSLALAMWAYWERGVARRQTQLSVANNLLVESQSDRHTGADGARLRVLLAAEAVQRLGGLGRSTADALTALDSAASLRARRLGSAPAGTDSDKAALSADGTRFVSWDGSQLVLRDTVDLRAERALPAPGRVDAVALDAAGAWLALADERGVWLQRTDDANASRLALQGCPGRVIALSFDQAATKLSATVAADLRAAGGACLWAVGDGRLLASETAAPQQAAGPTTAETAFSADGASWAAVVKATGQRWQVALYNAANGKRKRSWTLDSRLAGVAFRGQNLVIVEDRAVWAWDDAAQRETTRLPMQDKWQPLQLSPDGRFVTVRLFAGHSWAVDSFSYDLMGLFDTASGAQLAEMPTYQHVFSADGRYLVRSGAAGSEILALPSMQIARYVPEPGRLLLNHDTTLAVTVTEQGTPSSWSLGDAPQVLASAAGASAANAWAISPDGAWLAVGASRAVRIVDPAQPARIRTLPAPHSVRALAASPDGRYVVAVGSDRLSLWDTDAFAKRLDLTLGATHPDAPPCAFMDRECKQQAEAAWPTRHTQPLLFSHAGGFVAWAGAHAALAWSLPDGRPVITAKPVARGALLESGDRLLLGRNDGSVDVVDTRSWRSLPAIAIGARGAIVRLSNVDAGATVAALSAQIERSYGAALAARSTWSVVLFAPETGRVVGRYDGAGLAGPWSRDGRRFAVSSAPDAIEIVGTADGALIPVQVLLRQNVSQAMRPLGFSADGRFLYVESETPVTLSRTEPTVHIVDAASGHELSRMPVRTPRTDTIKLDRAAPYPERFVVGDGADHIVSLVFQNADQYWSVGAARAKKDLVVWRIGDDGRFNEVFRRATPEDLKPVQLDAGGGLLVTAPMDTPTGGVQVWAVNATQRLRLGCAAAAKDLTAFEWQRYIADYTGETQRPTCASLHLAEPSAAASDARR